MNLAPRKRHILYESSRDIRDIAEPLETYLGIKEFTYEKIYNNNFKIKLTNQPEWLSYFYENDFHLFGDDTIDALSSTVNLTSNLKIMNNDRSIFDPCRDLFGIGEGVLLIDFFDTYRELYWFTSDHIDKRVMFCEKYINLLKVFIKSFKEKASKIIKRAEGDKILRPAENIYVPISYENALENSEDFLKAMSLKKYTFQKGGATLSLTRRELECAVGLMKGKTAKEIAATLAISKRTIEKHIENIKWKTETSSKGDLMRLLWEFDVNIYLT